MSAKQSLISSLLLGLSIISNASALPARHHDDASGLAARRSATEQTVYYGVNTTEHERRSELLKAAGYSILSLSVYGSPPDVNYAAIWSADGDATFETIYGADEATFQSWVDTWKAKGYASTHVSATGPADGAVYAGVVAQKEVGRWEQLCNLESPWSFQNATGDSLTIKAVSMYGTPSSLRYCVLGHEDFYNEQQTAFFQSSSYVYDYEKTRAAETQKRFWRPTYLDISNDQVITAIFGDTSVGRWADATNLSGESLAAEIEAQSAKGLSPIGLQGGGSGSDARYTVIFGEYNKPQTRQWTTTGTVTGFRDNEGVTSALDSVMRTWMETNGIRQAQVSAAVNGTVVAERAFTWAEADRAVVQPDDKFLLASVSKMFTHAAAQRLIDAGMLNLSTAVFPLLGLRPADERANSVTVEHLVQHMGGWDRSRSGDIGFIFTEVARAKNSSTPATLLEVIEYVLAKPLDFAPGTYGAYSNFGAMVLSYLVANMTGVPYYQYIQENVLEGLDVEIYGTDGGDHVDDSIVQESKFTGPNVLQPQSTDNVPAIYGGDGANKEEAAGAYGLKASASTIARFIAKNAVQGIGGRSLYSSRDGGLSGARTYAESLGMGSVDWAVNINSREYVSEDAWSVLTYTSIYSIWNSYPLASPIG